MRRIMVSLTLVGTLTVTTAAWGLQQPGRTVTRPAFVGPVGLTHASVVFGVGRTKTDCGHVELWNTDTKGLWRFGKPHPCGDLPIIYGFNSVAVATSRVLWIEVAGGNLTDWMLWTATPTKRQPRQLAFVERETDLPAPVVIGQGTPEAVPYAVGDVVTWLADNGRPVFRTNVAGEVRMVTSGNGPLGWRVAALLDDGDVVLLNQAGALDATVPFETGDVKWIGLAPRGLLVQVGRRLEIHSGGPTKTVQLPANALVVDFAEGRILYRVGQRYVIRTLAGGVDTTILQGSQKRPLAVVLDAHGLAWARANTVSWACAACLHH
jgi:hypothetical protein